MSATPNVKADFCLKIDFEKSSKDPARVFRAAYELIDAMQALDSCLIDVIDSKIEPVLLLEDVEIGSLNIWLKNVLEELDDDAIKNLDWKPQVGKYLLDAKYLILDFCSKETQITNISQLAPLERDIFQRAQETNVNRLPHYHPVPTKELLEGVNKVTTALSNLHAEDKASYITPEKEIGFNLSFPLIPSIEDILTVEETKTEGTTILKVKKPDFLGDSQWEFKADRKSIKAKMLDTAWLSQYHDGQIILKPGDAIKVKMEHFEKFDGRGNIIAEQFNILEVLKVIDSNQPNQQLRIDS
jgi:hypothetical protein